MLSESEADEKVDLVRVAVYEIEVGPEDIIGEVSITDLGAQPQKQKREWQEALAEQGEWKT